MWKACDAEVLEWMDSLFWWMNDAFDSLIMFDLFLISLGMQQAGTSLIELLKSHWIAENDSD